MKDFVALKRTLRQRMDKSKTAQEINGYFVTKYDNGFMVTVEVEGEEMFVCTL